MKIATTIQVRMTSSRLPGKVLKPVLGKPLLQIMIERLKRIPSSQEIIVCTTTNKEDDPVVELAEKMKVKFYRGSENDVLSRVLEAVLENQVDLIVETTGDCPVIDPNLCERVIQLFLTGDYDYVSNILDRRYPRGMDVQVFPTKILQEVSDATTNPIDREHVSFYIYQHPEKYRLGKIVASPELTWPDLRLTVDTEEDFQLMKAVIEELMPKNEKFDITDMVSFLRTRPDLVALNSEIKQKAIKY